MPGECLRGGPPEDCIRPHKERGERIPALLRAKPRTEVTRADARSGEWDPGIYIYQEKIKKRSRIVLPEGGAAPQPRHCLTTAKLAEPQEA